MRQVRTCEAKELEIASQLNTAYERINEQSVTRWKAFDDTILQGPVRIRNDI